MRIDELLVLVIFKPVCLDVLFMESRTTEAVFAGCVEVGFNRGVDVLVPFVGSEDLAGENCTEYRAGVVVSVINPFVGVGSSQQTIGRALRIGSWSVLEFFEGVVRGAFSYCLIFLIVK